MVIFVTSSHQFSMKFHDNSKNKNRRIFLLYFPFYSAHSASYIKFPPVLRGGGGVCISLSGKKPKFSAISFFSEFSETYANKIGTLWVSFRNSQGSLRSRVLYYSSEVRYVIKRARVQWNCSFSHKLIYMIYQLYDDVRLSI